MAESAAQKKAREKREADAVAAAEQAKAAEATPGSGDDQKPEDTAGTQNANPDEASGTASQAEVDAQRDAEGKGDGSDAPLGGTSEKPVPSDDADQKADPNIQGVATTGEAQDQREARGESVGTFSNVQQQRDAEAEAAAKREGIRRGDLDADGNVIERSAEEQALLDAAPGGQRTLLTGSSEGSTKVRDTAAFASPASGPLHDPVNDITNLNARDDDPDNRVYGDDAGPRDEVLTGVGVETQTRIVDGNGNAPETRFLDGEGNPLSYEDIFDDQPNRTFVTTKVRVREAFVYPNTDTVGYRIAYTEGKKVPRGEAENVRRMIEGDNR